jgi:hypothetical protein
MPAEPIALTDAQITSIFAAARPLPADRRSDFLEACAREIAAMPEVGDGALYRIITAMQKRYFDPPDLANHKGAPVLYRSVSRRRAVEA